METHAPRRHLTGRDVEILLALDRSPLTVRQLLKLSQVFAEKRFVNPRTVQDRLHKLRQAGWIRRWTYATATRCGAPDYYKLTLLGYRLLYGASAQPTTKRQFNEVSIAHQHHTHSLAEFIVHTLVAAAREGVQVRSFCRENTLRFKLGKESLFPDSAFELHTHAGHQYNFFVELDNGTERVRSDKDMESWQRKVRLYEQRQDEIHPQRFRVLVVTTRSRNRLDHILGVAASHARNPSRTLLYGVHLDDYLLHADAVRHPCFRNHRGRMLGLLPLEAETLVSRMSAMDSAVRPDSGIVLPLSAATSP